MSAAAITASVDAVDPAGRSSVSRDPLHALGVLNRYFQLMGYDIAYKPLWGSVLRKIKLENVNQVRHNIGP